MGLTKNMEHFNESTALAGDSLNASHNNLSNYYTEYFSTHRFEAHTKTNHMPSREIIIAKREQKMTDLLGHSNNFATLSISVTNSQLYIVKYRGRPRDNIWIFLQTCKEV